MNHSPSRRLPRSLRAAFVAALAALASLFVLASLGGCFGGSSAGPDSGLDFDSAAPTLDSSSPSNEAGPDSSHATDATPEASEAAPSTFTIGGHVTGLSGTGLVLSDNGSDSLPVSSDGAFAFKVAVASGGAYAVTVATQPSHPTQTCTVAAGTGTATADVSDVQIACSTQTYPVGGTLVGLDPSSKGGLVLADTLSGGTVDTVTVNQNGSFTFPTKVADGSAFAVSVQTNPASPPQTCAVGGATGTIVGAAVGSVVVNCALDTYVVGGTVSGLSGVGLVVQNGADSVTISANGTFAFPTPVATGGSYAVTVSTQPAGPSQTCSVVGGSGPVASANITSVAITCVTDTFTVGGNVSGLTGTGLTLQNSGGETISVKASGDFQFSTAIASGAAYSVVATVQPQNPWQTCTVTGGTGTVGAGPVTTVQVACVSNLYPVNLATSGLAGTGLVINVDGVGLSITQNGTLDNLIEVSSGTAYTVAVTSQPTSPTQVCSVASPAGVIANGPLAIALSCVTQSFALGGQVDDLLGTGLTLTNSGGDPIKVAADATAFTFDTKVASATKFDVEIGTQPTNPSQTCKVSGNTGTILAAPVTSVVVNCGTNSFPVGGMVNGLAGGGLVLQTGTQTLQVTSQGSFSFLPIASGTAYDVVVATQPTVPTQICTVTAGEKGTVGSAAVSNVVVACTTQSFNVGVNVSNLAGSGLIMEDNGADDLPIKGNGAVNFATKVLSNTAYAVSVKTQPTTPWQTCTPLLTSNIMAGADVSVPIGCTTNTYQVNANVTGLVGTGLTLTVNNANATSIKSNATVPLGAKIASGTTYTVAVQTPPTTPAQTCTITPPSTVIAGADVTVGVACTTESLTVGGNVVGLTGSGLVLTNTDNNDTLKVTAGASPLPFTMPTKVLSGTAYNLVVSTQPTNPPQVCQVAGGSAAMGNAAVNTITVNCSTQYSIGGTITVTSGALGKGLQLSDGLETISPTATGGFAFSKLVPSGTPYTVTVTGQPTSPTASCSISPTTATGTATSNVNTVAVTCTPTPFTVGGTISNLFKNTKVVLEDNNGDDLTVNQNGGFTFLTSVASGAAYSVTVKTQPSSPYQTCSVLTNGAGAVGNGPITNVTVNCVLITEGLSGTASGVTAPVSLALSVNNAGTSETVNVPAQAGSFAFTSKLNSGSTYAVSVTAPETLSCTLGNATGVVTNVPIAMVLTCVPAVYTVGINVTNGFQNFSACTVIPLVYSGSMALTVSAILQADSSVQVPGGGNETVTFTPGGRDISCVCTTDQTNLTADCGTQSCAFNPIADPNVTSNVVVNLYCGHRIPPT